MAERFYEAQKVERTKPWSTHIVHYGAEWPCMQGITPVGMDTIESALDGHKYICGADFIAGDPIVYSFGSNKKQDFEEGFLEQRPDAHIFVYEVEQNLLPNNPNPLIFFNTIPLGYNARLPRAKSLAEIMAMNNHTYIAS